MPTSRAEQELPELTDDAAYSVIVPTKDKSQQVEPRSVSKNSYASPLLILLLILLFYFSLMLLFLNSFQGDYSGFIRFAEFRAEINPFLQEHSDLRRSLKIRTDGYDGQFYFNMSFDPFLKRFENSPRKYRFVVDNPRYRYARIGYPLLIKLFSFNRPEFFAPTMVWLVLSSLLMGAIFLMKIVLFFHRSPFWALSYLIIPGFATSLNLALPEPIAAAFLLGGIYFYLKERLPIAVLFLSFSFLIRETGVIFICVLIFLELFYRKRKKSALIMGCSLIPYVLWKGYITWQLFPVHGLSTFFFSPKIFGFPFLGIANLFVQGRYSPSEKGLLVFAVLIVTNLFFGIFFTVVRKNPWNLSVLVYSIMQICLTYKVWNGMRNIERTTYEGFVLLILAVLAGSNHLSTNFRERIWLFLAAIGAYTIFLSSQASAYRDLLGFLF
jgi:hypothetical protein